MCRLLCVKSQNNFEISSYLKAFSSISKNSREYQGHGWGCAYIQQNEWKYYKNINPIWEDDLDEFGATNQLLAHARSAFRDEGISIENNMPFGNDKKIFIFNGELHGVKIKAEGKIGAEKIFNYMKRFENGNFYKAINKAVAIIKKRTKYIKAMNFIISDRDKVYVSSLFNEDPDYFTMYMKQSQDTLIICSEKLPIEKGWKKIDNNTIKEFS